MVDEATISCLSKLSRWLKQQHGIITTDSLQKFYASSKAAGKCKALIDRAGGLERFIDTHGHVAIPPLKYTTFLQFARTEEAVEKLALWLQTKPLPPQSTLGVFRKQHDEYAFMWSDRLLQSIKPFIQSFGQCKNGKLQASGSGINFKITWNPTARGSTSTGPIPAPVRASSPPSLPVQTKYEYVATLKRAKECFNQLKTSPFLVLDLEGDLSENGRMSLLQIKGENTQIYIMDIYVCPNVLRDASIAAVLESKLIILHDARSDYTGLLGQFNIDLDKIFDTQVAHQIITSDSVTCWGLNNILQAYANVQNTLKASVQHGFGVWDQRPLPNRLLDYAAQDVEHLPKAFARMKELMSNEMYDKCLIESKLRAQKRANKSILSVLAHLTAFLKKNGNRIHASDLVRFYNEYPNDRNLMQPTIKAFVDQHGSLISPKIIYKANHLELVMCAEKASSTKNVDITTCLKLLATFIGERGDKIEGKDFGEFYKSFCGVEDVIRGNGNTASGFIKLHGSKSTPPIVFKGSKFTFEKQQEKNQPSAQELLKEYGAKFTLDKYGITITDNQEFKKALNTNQKYKQVYTISNAKSATVTLVRYFQIKTARGKSPFQLLNTNLSNVLLPAGTSVKASCAFESTLSGRYKTILAFEFKTISGQSFLIGRIIDQVDCVDENMDEGMREEVTKPTRKRYRRKKSKLEFALPTDIYKSSSNGSAPLAINLAPYKYNDRDYSDAIFSHNLIRSTYLLWFRTLLIKEESAHVKEQQDYDMDSAVLIQKNSVLYELVVPGLSENRPSLMAGDKVWLSRNANSKTYEAVIFQVRLDTIVMRAPASFSSTFRSSPTFNVRFIMSRTPMRLMHQGITLSILNEQTSLLFPTQPSCSLRSTSFGLTLSSGRPINPEQLQAVKDVMTLVRSYTAPKIPYLLFGPPGTGKTVTVVEAILQLLKAVPKIKILVCAPSNAAADNIVDRVANSLSSRHLLRMMAYYRRQKDTPNSVLPFTLQNDEGGFDPPSLEEIQAAPIVVSTIATGSKLYNIGIRRGYFDLIVFDEAAQASEPEVLGVLGPLATNSTSVLLAGDPMQLGPVVKSSSACNYGLDISLMERLIQRPIYQSTHKTKLLRNYRSHQDILKVPNALFYEDELTYHAPSTVNSFLGWRQLPNKSCPLIFHGITGSEQQDADSPSWYNLYEVQAILNYVAALLQKGIATKDIGIITPYAKQRQKMNQQLQKRNINGITVGSVEQFQGGERKVMLMTTVRSSTAFFADDEKFSLGFVSHSKRFNVAITRAQALLIVVGNPLILETNSNWSLFLEHCVRLDACVGVKPPKATKTIDSEKNLQSFDIDDEEDEVDEMEMYYTQMLEYEQMQQYHYERRRREALAQEEKIRQFNAERTQQYHYERRRREALAQEEEIRQFNAERTQQKNQKQSDCTIL
ncbi:RNA helicase [Thraustotheca clavata]|uniref:RNA helicase n=1 Tax=Thraustotheca clavata TaxID=74557 RepID=A0A1V9ZCG8_9STRA|nr:RNA helicase [Thraustotheca clavata]